MAADELSRTGDDLGQLHKRIAAVLGPRRRQLTEAVMAEIEQEAVDRMAAVFVDETRIKSMDFRNGASMDIQPAREIVAAWVAAARAMLGDAPNYSETEIDFGLADPPGYEMEVKLAGEVDRYVFRVQRRGKLTPHQARQAAEERAERAEAKLAEFSAFWLVTDEDGGIILNGPCADTLGCLWSSSFTGERVTLDQLTAAAGTHTGMEAGEMHARLAVATGMTEEGPPNNGSPVINSGAVAPGGWVCAVPVPGNPDHICGMPVESEPCTEHGEAS